MATESSRGQLVIGNGSKFAVTDAAAVFADLTAATGHVVMITTTGAVHIKTAASGTDAATTTDLLIQKEHGPLLVEPSGGCAWLSFICPTGATATVYIARRYASRT